MKILHTSDWHLGKHLNNFSRHPEQIEVLCEICEIADREQVHAIIVAGDLFDTYNPPIESTELFYKTLKRLTANGKRPVIAIAGNHDSPDRIEAPDPLARECGILFAGYPNSIIAPFELESGLKVLKSEEGFISLKLPEINEPLQILLTPYANEFRLKTYLGAENSEEELRTVLQSKWADLANRHCDNKSIHVLLSHLLLMKKGDELPEEPEDEKPILHVGGAQAIYTENIPPQIQYTALGHLHRKQQVDKNIIYSGSPLAYSFSEANQNKYVILAEIEPGKPAEISEIELTRGKRLLRKRSENIDEAVEWLNEHPNSLVELTMVTETYLTAEERKRLTSSHDGIVSLIPEVKSQHKTAANNKAIDLNKSMEALFSDYFRHAKGQEPSGSMLNLFREILSEEDAQ
ncbi:MAG: exonuclease subunit SbcD [Bacteroidales bacterium]|nr:exonuclease subunit SbcD [Bacteroidales bacterium]